MIRCKGETLYTGITTDIKRRMEEHQNKTGAKYTKSRPPEKIECLWTAQTRQMASKLEYYIKTLTKPQKEALIKNKNLLNEFLGEKIDITEYISVK